MIALGYLDKCGNSMNNSRSRLIINQIVIRSH